MAIWVSWNIDIRQNLNSRDSFPGRKFEKLAPISCRPGAIVSLSTISFDVHEKVAEEINLEMCSYEQLSKVQMLLDLDLDLGSSQGHVNIYSICRTTRMPNRVTVGSRTTEIWPFECCQISTLDKVWTLVIAFLEGNSINNQKAPKGGCGHRRQHARLR